MPRLFTRIAVAFGLLVVGAAIGMWVLNALLLPALVDRLEGKLEAAIPIEIGVGSVRLRLLGGIELEDVSVAPAGKGAWRFETATARVSVRPVSVLRRAWGLTTEKTSDLSQAYAAAREALRHGMIGEAFRRGGAAAAAAGVFPQRVQARDAGLTVPLPWTTEPLPLSFESLTFTHHRERATLRLDAEKSGSTGVDGRLHADYRDGSGTLGVDVTDYRFPRLGWGSSYLSPGEVTGHAAISFSGAGTTEVDGAVRSTNGEAFAPALAPAAVGPLDLRADGTVTVDRSVPPRRGPYGPPGGSITVHDARFEFNGLGIELRGVLSGLGHEEPHPVSRAPTLMPRLLEANVELPRTPVSRIREALPEAVLGPLTGIELEGTLAWGLDLWLPRYSPSRAAWSSQTELRDLALLEIPEAVDPRKLTRGFVHRITDSDGGHVRLLWIPPPRQPPTLPADEGFPVAKGFDSPPPVAADGESAGYAAVLPQPTAKREAAEEDGYVRLSRMSPWLPRAVLTTEDGDFYYHGGVNFRTLARAAERNMREGRIVGGASTISMQLAKMLFLDDTRVFSRKLQEAFLVYLMEHHVGVPKDRILEIYLNIAEFGPDVYGVAQAAQYYFDRDAAELSAGEAMWLATILPAPRRYHYYFEQGEISEGWFERMKSYYDIMLARGRMTEEQYTDAMEHKPSFAR
ncbi:MAG: transglycosylase domain-containing protein [Spirochaetaceae bacterium]